MPDDILESGSELHREEIKNMLLTHWRKLKFGNDKPEEKEEEEACKELSQALKQIGRLDLATFVNGLKSKSVE